MRFRHKKTRIVMSKMDLDAAYRRIHVSWQAAVSCITIVQDLAYLLLRLPFGSSPAASEFSIFSDIAVDLTSEIADDPSWDPSSIHSSNYDFR